MDRRNATAPDERAQARAQLRAALSRLPQRDQLLLALLTRDPPASYAEIYDQLGIPIGSIGPTRARALNKLRELLSDFRPEVPQVHRTAVSPRQLANLAAFLAGRKRSGLRDEWRSHLSGETGHGLARKDQIRAARGFLCAAVRYRLRDAADLAWRPADAVLGSRTLSNLFVAGPVIVMLVAIVHHNGRFGLVADVQDPVALSAFLYGVIRTGRWWRGVKPPEPKASRARSGGGDG